jgi:hypothetical protein
MIRSGKNAGKTEFTYTLKSLFREVPLVLEGGCIPSSRKSAVLTKHEIARRRVDEGLHSYVDIADASSRPHDIVLPIVVDCSDVVTFGWFTFAHKQCLSAVSTRAEIDLDKLALLLSTSKEMYLGTGIKYMDFMVALRKALVSAVNRSRRIKTGVRVTFKLVA